jgi:hypothetical protein
VQRVPTASRRLLVLVLVVTSLVVPSSAASDSGRSITYAITGTLGANGWYTSNVHVDWTVTPSPYSETSGCLPTPLNNDTPGATLTCSATWINPGETLTRSVTIKIDKTPPSASGHPARPPDANGWYNHPVPVSFAGSDGTSGLAGCSSTTYSGPDNSHASVAGTCTDHAGNVGHATYGLSYDATPPSLGNLTAKPGDRSVLLGWTASPDAQVAQVTRSRGSGPSKTIYSGMAGSFRDKGLRRGAKYHYTVTAFDVAANSAAQTLTVTATGRLINPAPGEHVSSPPRLAWLPVNGARYYNVQLIRGGRIMSAWPTHANLKLPRRWVYQGHRYRLRPGVYRWYVWPGFGRLAQAHYGRMLGGSSFVYGG